MKSAMVSTLSALFLLCACGPSIGAAPAALPPPDPAPTKAEVAAPIPGPCPASGFDERANAELMKRLVDDHDQEAAACYARMLEAFQPGEKETERDARHAARAVLAANLRSAGRPLLDAFLALRVSRLRAEPELYRDVHDAMLRLADPAWEPQLLERLAHPMPADRNDIQNLRDEVFWQTTAAEILGRLRSTAAVRPLLEAAVSPLKADIALTAIYALIQIGEPSVAPAVALLRGEDKDLAELVRSETLRAGARPDGAVPDAITKAAERAYVGAAAIVLCAIGREDITPAVLDVLGKLDKTHDVSRAVVARELPKLPMTPEVVKAFQAVYERTPPSLSIPPGGGAREALAEQAGYFFDARLVPWIVKTALDLNGAPEDMDEIRGASLVTALKLMTPDQTAVVTKLLRARATGSDGRPTTLGKLYEREVRLATALLSTCDRNVDCYFDKLVDPASQVSETQFQGVKAAFMIAVLGGPDVRQRLLDALPRLPNPMLRFLVGQIIDHHSPRGDAGLAAALRRIVADGYASGDVQQIMANAAFKMVVYRLDARAAPR